jgi:hypothetical protein
MCDPARPASLHAFVAPITQITATQPRHAIATVSATCSRTCTSCGGTGRVQTRRAVLQSGLAALVGLSVAAVGANASRADDALPAADAKGEDDKKDSKEQKAKKQKLSDTLADDAPRCKNCLGNGKIPCDLCSGTGFWRALARNDINQKYQGTVCPECEGVGTLTCPVCLGTGEGNIRGLLRRRRVTPGPGRILQTNEFDDV